MTAEAVSSEAEEMSRSGQELWTTRNAMMMEAQEMWKWGEEMSMREEEISAS